MKLLIIILPLLTFGCMKKVELACGAKRCPKYFQRYWDSSTEVADTIDKYVATQKQFQLDNTYNDLALNDLVRTEGSLNECLESTPLGNTGVRRRFHHRKSNPHLRDIYETDRYFQDKLSGNNEALRQCFIYAQEDIEALMLRYPPDGGEII